MNNNRNKIKTFITAFVILAAAAFTSVLTALRFQEPVSYSEDAIFYDDIWETTVSTATLLSENSYVEETVSAKTSVSETKKNISVVSSAFLSDTEPDITSEHTTVCSETYTVTEQTVQDGLININTATVEELQQLKGIGPVIAERIAEYARTSGFSSIEEIKNVKGIGEKKFEAIKDKITV